jgi:hypothetical protein
MNSMQAGRRFRGSGALRCTSFDSAGLSRFAGIGRWCRIKTICSDTHSINNKIQSGRVRTHSLCFSATIHNVVVWDIPTKYMKNFSEGQSNRYPPIRTIYRPKFRICSVPHTHKILMLQFKY